MTVKDIGDGTIYDDLRVLLQKVRVCLLEIEEKVQALDQQEDSDHDG